MSLRTAILIPSLGRPQYVRRTYGNIEANTPELHDQFWCVSGDEYADILDELSREHGLGLYTVRDDVDPDKRYVTRMNKLAATVRDYDFVFFGSDDVVHHPGWLTEAITVMEEAENASVVVVNDLRNPNGTQALVRTSYLNRAVFDDPSVAFHPGYQHNFADTEMFITAAAQGVIYRALQSHVEHLHPLHQGASQRPWDETYANAQSHWDYDAHLFNQRAALIKEHFRAA